MPFHAERSGTENLLYRTRYIYTTKIDGEGRKEGTCLFDIHNHNAEYTTVKFCRETPTKAQSVPLSPVVCPPNISETVYVCMYVCILFGGIH